MNVSVSCKNAHGEVRVIPSKSFAHRALICAALSDNPTELVCDAMSQDIEATIACIRALGAEVQKCGASVFVTPARIPESARFDCGESGSTLRFMIPVAAALGMRAEFCGHGRLPQRPLGPLLEAIGENGAEFEYGGFLPLTVTRGISGGRFSIRGDVSSQFISGLILALPLLDTDSEIEITGKLESGKYIDITLDVVSEFGAEVSREGNIICIKGTGGYKTPSKFEVEGDWSNAAFWAVLGAFSKEGITCRGVDNDSVQGDREVLNILRRFGAKVECGNGFFKVSEGELCGTEIDAAEIPDLIPVLSVAAAVARGETVIHNIERLRIKESDRVLTTEQMIKNLGGEIRVCGDKMFITGRKNLRGGGVSAENDHRIAMSAVVAAAACDGDVKIIGAEAVGKSYGNFFDEYEKLGGKYMCLGGIEK